MFPVIKLRNLELPRGTFGWPSIVDAPPNRKGFEHWGSGGGGLDESACLAEVGSPWAVFAPGALRASLIDSEFCAKSLNTETHLIH